MIILKSQREIDRMRVPCSIVAEILVGLRALVRPGVTTLELDQFASAEAIKRKSKCAFKGYSGFPSSL